MPPRRCRCADGPTGPTGPCRPVRGCAPGNTARDVRDAGCGTDSLDLLLARDGHRVTGVDLAPRMVEHARATFLAAGAEARFLVGGRGGAAGERGEVRRRRGVKCA